MNVPPCIDKAVKARDTEAMDEIFSYLKTFADNETREAVLWAIGYYTLDNYQQKKITAENRMRVAETFMCSADRKPTVLGKYCTEEDMAKCPLRDPRQKLRAMIAEVLITPGQFPMSSDVIIKLKNGAKFVIYNKTFVPTNTWPAFKNIAQRFIGWMLQTHGSGLGISPTEITVEDVAELLRDLYVQSITGITGVKTHDKVAPLRE